MNQRLYDLDEDGEPVCTNPGGHSFVCEDVDGLYAEGRSYCEYCLADGDA